MFWSKSTKTQFKIGRVNEPLVIVFRYVYGLGLRGMSRKAEGKVKNILNKKKIKNAI
jgi:hypothetical protein